MAHRRVQLLAALLCLAIVAALSCLVSADPHKVKIAVQDDADETAAELRVMEPRTDCPADCSKHGTCSNGVCQCNSDYAGADCSIFDKLMTLGQPVDSSVDRRSWKFFHVVLTRNAPNLILSGNLTGDGDCDYYLRYQYYPDKFNYTARDISLDDSTHIQVSNPSAGTWYAGVYGFEACHFSIMMSIDFDICDCSGHGSCTGPNGACVCSEQYYGPKCENEIIELTPGVAVPASVDLHQWNYYTFRTTTRNVLTVNVAEDGRNGDSDIYIRFGGLPSIAVYDYRQAGLEHSYHVLIPQPQIGVYYIGVYGYRSCSYQISVQVSSECANRCSLHGTCNVDVCNCDSEYQGTFCETMVPDLALNTSTPGFVNDGVWNYYHYTSASNNDLQITVAQTTQSADCDLFVRQSVNPTSITYDYSDRSLNQQFTVTIPSPGSSTWYFGILGYSSCEYSISVNELIVAQCPNDCNGHGTCDQGACQCDSNFTGEDCSIGYEVIENMAVVSGSVGPQEWKYYQIPVVSGSELAIFVKETNAVNFIWLFARAQSPPDLRLYDYSSRATSVSPSMPVHRAYLTPLQGQVYYIGIYGSPLGQGATEYQLSFWDTPF